jgi:hypothetical protein
MVAEASVIVLTSYEDTAEMHKAVVAEILKQDPGVLLHYEIGDEMPVLSVEKREGVTCGDGQVVFMTGSPATMTYSASFTDGRIAAMGDLPLTRLREVVSGKRPQS